MDIEQAERAARARADLITAIVLAVLGLIVVYASWTMPRLEARHIHPARPYRASCPSFWASR